MDEFQASTSTENTESQSEIKSYEAPWLIYAMNFSHNHNYGFRVAIGSFIEAQENKVEILQIHEETDQLECKFQFDHLYPPTKIMWIPDKDGTRQDLLVTSGDYLRVWQVSDTGATIKSRLNKKRQNDYSAPLTSFDWNNDDLNRVGASSIDTTCTIWDIERESITTQIIAHEKEVYDFAFGHGVNTFASVGADGSVRSFDLRSLEHSTILYESQDFTPLLRVAWNRMDPNYLATLAMDSTTVIILDVRTPAVPLFELNSHDNTINSLCWAPKSSCHICSAGDDCNALIWDLQKTNRIVEDPSLCYQAEAEVNMLQWSELDSNWLGISFNKKLQLLRI